MYLTTTIAAFTVVLHRPFASLLSSLSLPLSLRVSFLASLFPLRYFPCLFSLSVRLQMLFVPFSLTSLRNHSLLSFLICSFSKTCAKHLPKEINSSRLSRRFQDCPSMMLCIEVCHDLSCTKWCCAIGQSTQARQTEA